MKEEAHTNRRQSVNVSMIGEVSVGFETEIVWLAFNGSLPFGGKNTGEGESKVALIKPYMSHIP